MNLIGPMFAPALLLLAGGCASTGLAFAVLLRHPGRHAHRVYAGMGAAVAVWSFGAGVAMVSTTDAVAWAALAGAFAAASLFPALFYHFCACFPDQRFEGVRVLDVLIHAGCAMLALGAFSPWFLAHVAAGQPPVMLYGPLFMAHAFLMLLAASFGFANLVMKLREAVGVRRRQLEHAVLGILAVAGLAGLFHLAGWVQPLGGLAVVAPLLLALYLGVVCYSMLRYHLLDIGVLFSRTALYFVLTAFVMAAFAGAVGLVHWVLSGGGRTADFLSTGLAALLVVLLIQPLKEAVRLLLERVVLKRRYDAAALLSRISGHASQFMHLDGLLQRVVADLQHTLGVRHVRVLLASEKEPGTVVTEYSTRPEELKRRSTNFRFLLEYLAKHPEPVVLERLLYQRPEHERVRLAHTLAELDAFLCVPLRTAKGVIGLLLLSHKSTHDIYTAADMAVFSALAFPLGSAIENARLYRKVEEVNLHLERIMANMRGGVLAIDERGTVKTVNQGARDILGDIQPGAPLSAVNAEVASLLHKALASGRPLDDLETVVRGPDGEQIPVLVSTSPLLTGAGEPLGAMALLFNLSQLKRLEAKVQRADRLSSLGTVAAGMAHEIKNPLVSIKTFTQLLPVRYDDPEFRETFTDVVPNEVERINTIVSRLLDFARPKPVRFEPQDLRQVVDRVLVLLDNEIRKHGIRVTTDFPETVRLVSGDEQQLHQVFLNLLLNAIDALAESDDRSLHIVMNYNHLHLHPGDMPPQYDVECATLSVADSGCGIPGDKVEEVFTPFFSTKSSGSGLGLAVAHGIVMNHGGAMDVSSIPDVGTIFSVSLPLIEAQSHAESLPA